MKTTKSKIRCGGMLTIVVLALGLMVLPASVAEGRQSLTVNGQDVNSITLELGQTCTVEVVSDDGTSYELYVGFYKGPPVLGDFSHLETKPEAGGYASVAKYNELPFYGYRVTAAGKCYPRPCPPRPGVHFVFEYEAQLVGETDVVLAELIKDKFVVIDSVHITVIPAPMGTAITYQGRLLDEGSPADGLYDLEFKLYRAPNGGIQEGNTIDINDLDVIEGQFTVELDFGSDPSIFNGDARWLQIGVRLGDFNDPCDYTVLSPRIEITPVPYALHTRGVFVGDENTFVGRDAGYSNTTGNHNTFLGNYAGRSNTTGYYNTFLGTYAGYSNTTGNRNTFLGYVAGSSNTTGNYNTFLGNRAGNSNTTGNRNTFLGRHAGYSNTTGFRNTFLGNYAGYSNTEGSYNTFLGYQAGSSNTTGEHNTFLGNYAGFSNTTGYRNTFLGRDAGRDNQTGAGNVFIGDRAGYRETGSNKLYIANSAADPPLIYGDFSTGKVGIGTTSPGAGLHLKGTGYPSSFMYLQSDANEDTGFRLYEGTAVKWHIFNDWANDGLRIYNSGGTDTVFFAEQSTGNVSIGTTNPDEWSKLTVVATGPGQAVSGENSASGNWGYLGGNITAVYGRALGGTTNYAGYFVGRVRVRVLEITGGSDVSEQFEVSDEGGKVKPGMVVCIDADNSGSLVVSKESYDRTVAGIVSGAGGVKPGMLMGQKGTEADGEHPIALTGRVYCWADASNGPIEPGDLLTTSDMAGHAMKVTDYTKAQGAILGKAMSSLDKGKGLVLVLVSLQ